MSHSTKCGPYTFIHDGDALSGIVEIVNTSGTRFKVMGTALRQFVAGAVRDAKIAELEHADDRTILGLQ